MTCLQSRWLKRDKVSLRLNGSGSGRVDFSYLLIRVVVADNEDQTEWQSNGADEEENDGEDEVFSLHALPTTGLWLFDEVEGLGVILSIRLAELAQILVEVLFVCWEEGRAVFDVSSLWLLHVSAGACAFFDVGVGHVSCCLELLGWSGRCRARSDKSGAGLVSAKYGYDRVYEVQKRDKVEQSLCVLIFVASIEVKRQ